MLKTLETQVQSFWSNALSLPSQHLRVCLFSQERIPARIDCGHRRKTIMNVFWQNSDLQAGSYLVKDYREIILSQNVLSCGHRRIETRFDTSQANEKDQCIRSDRYRILSITGQDGDPKEAACTPNGLRNVAAAKINLCDQGVRCYDFGWSRSASNHPFSTK